MIFSRSRRVWVACLPALLLVATACQKTSQFKVGANDINPMPAGQLASGGTLNWPLSQLPDNYNFNSNVGSLGDEASLIYAVMPTLFNYNALGQPVLDTDYLTKASVTSSSPQVVTYEINPQAKWSDGTPITAADFIAQWKALNGKDPTFNAASTAGYEDISSVTQGTGAGEVLVSFTSPFSAWQGLFTPLYPAALNATSATFNAGWVTGTVTSAGPFVMQGIDHSVQTATVVRNPAWWGTKPVLNSIVYHSVGTDASKELAALRRGTIDFVQLPALKGPLTSARDIKGTTIRTAGGPQFRVLTLNAESPNLQDIKVRQAVGLAIDRQALAKAILGPLGVPDATLNNHIFMADERGYQDNAGMFGTSDARRAGTLLDQAGFKLVKGVRTKNGQAMQLRMVIPSDNAAAAQEAGLIKKDLEGVGIKVQVQGVPAQTFFPSYVAAGDFDLTLYSQQGSTSPIVSSQSVYQNPLRGSNGAEAIGQNYARVGSPALDQLIAQALAELDPTRAITLGNRIDIMIWGEVHSLPLYEQPQIVVQKSSLANFGAFGFANPDYQAIGFAKS
ncbi:MAG TPA: ABC transporter family substrate-binding protein [Actinomycetota bacterium]|nr:ABC transporter family substrate-binding protein [Actinomycetota bacterium]